jgi:nucleoredoxin
MPKTLVSLLGESLVNKSGDKIDTATVSADNDIVGLYFSAHWCGPCRGFTPQLAKWYPELHDKKKFEIVFVSSDRDQASFDNYLNEMPWLALGFDQRDIKSKLSSKFKVQGIPSLILVDAKTGKLVNGNGRAAISGDPTGENFPWRPKTFYEMVDGHVADKDGNDVSIADLKSNDAVGVYFSAHWCPPCKMFTPILAKSYTEMRAAGKKFEVVFVSSDRDEASFNGYFGEMPWKAVKFASRSVKEELSSAFDVEGIPTFVILDGATGKVINANGRAAIMGDPAGDEFPWKPKPVNELGPSTASALNERPVLVAVLPDDADTTAPVAALTAVKTGKSGDDEKKAANADDDDDDDDDDNLAFMYCKASNGIVEVLARVTGLPATELVFIVDVTTGSSCASGISSVGSITEDAVAKFVESWRNGTATKKPLNV